MESRSISPTAKPLPATPPPSEHSIEKNQTCDTASPSISEASESSDNNVSPESKKAKEVIVNFHWAQYLAPYDELAAANFELPRVPRIYIDLEKGTVHRMSSQPSRSQEQLHEEGNVDDADFSDVMVIDRAALDAREHARKLESVKDLLRRVGIQDAKTSPVRRTIRRKKL